MSKSKRPTAESRFNQRGGTLLGLMLGVFACVLVAAAVAIYVARIPVPFVDRLDYGDNLDAAGAQQNENWNPNTALDGYDRPRPAGSGADVASGLVTPLPEPAPITSPDDNDTYRLPEPLPPPAVVGSGQDDRGETAPSGSHEAARAPASADPLGELVATHTQSPSAPAAASNQPDPFLYFVQAGAFRTARDADAQRARLSLAGVQARVSEREQAGRLIYRVRVGPFDSRDMADNMKSRLGNSGFDVALVRVLR